MYEQVLRETKDCCETLQRTLCCVLSPRERRRKEGNLLSQKLPGSERWRTSLGSTTLDGIGRPIVQITKAARRLPHGHTVDDSSAPEARASVQLDREGPELCNEPDVNEQTR